MSYIDCLFDKTFYVIATRTVGTVMPYIILGVTDDVTTQSVPRRRDGLSPLISIQFPIGDELESVVGVCYIT